MVLAFLCKTILTGQIAVVGNMKAQGLYHGLAFLKVYHIILIDICGKQLLGIDQLLGVGKGVLQILLRVFSLQGRKNCVLLILCELLRLFHIGHNVRQGLYHIIKKGVHRMDRAAVNIQDDMISVVDILMNQNNSPICVVN